MIKRILVPVDFSEASLEALEHALDLAKTYTADIVLMNAIEPIHYPDPAAMFLADQKAFARAELDRLAEKLARRQVACRTILRVGPPHAEIVKAATDDHADMIVMSTHGRTGFSHLMMGSVAEKVVRASACPVLTVRCSKGSEKARRRAASAA
jgi:nucleotide-binding universal stress UspA family protein